MGRNRRYEFDDSLLVAAARLSTGANVHHIQSLTYAYKEGNFPICGTQIEADLLAIRIRRLLRGVDPEVARSQWKIEFDKIQEKS